MSRNLPRKALISISSFNGAIYPSGGKTGLFFEALHAIEVLTGAGFAVAERSMKIFQWLLVMLVGAVCLTAFARWINVPYPWRTSYGVR